MDGLVNAGVGLDTAPVAVGSAGAEVAASMVGLDAGASVAVAGAPVAGAVREDVLDGEEQPASAAADIARTMMGMIECFIGLSPAKL